MANCGCNCDGNTPGVDYTSLPLLTGCPSDAETFLVGNATGGLGVGKYARRKWEDIKACTTGGRYTVLTDTITSSVGPAGSVNYQNDALINATQVKFIIVNKQVYTYEDGDFAFNENTGTVVFITISLFEGDKITIPYQAA